MNKILMKVKFAMKKSHLSVFEVMEPGGQYELNIRILFILIKLLKFPSVLN